MPRLPRSSFVRMGDRTLPAEPPRLKSQTTKFHGLHFTGTKDTLVSSGVRNGLEKLLRMERLAIDISDSIASSLATERLSSIKKIELVAKATEKKRKEKKEKRRAPQPVGPLCRGRGRARLFASVSHLYASRLTQI
jgi:hypothetical protein